MRQLPCLILCLSFVHLHTMPFLFFNFSHTFKQITVRTLDLFQTIEFQPLFRLIFECCYVAYILNTCATTAAWFDCICSSVHQHKTKDITRLPSHPSHPLFHIYSICISTRTFLPHIPAVHTTPRMGNIRNYPQLISFTSHHTKGPYSVQALPSRGITTSHHMPPSPSHCPPPPPQRRALRHRFLHPLTPNTTPRDESLGAVRGGARRGHAGGRVACLCRRCAQLRADRARPGTCLRGDDQGACLPRRVRCEQRCAGEADSAVARFARGVGLCA